MRSSESPYRAAVSMWLTPWRKSTSRARSASAWLARASAAAPNSVTLLRWPVRPKGRRSIIAGLPRVGRSRWTRAARGRRRQPPTAPGRFSRDSACAVRRALPRRRCVLPGQLRCRAFLLLLLPVQPRLAAPGALEVVADVEGQAAHPLGLDLDPVAVLEATEPPVIGAGRDDVARVERVDRGDPLDAARNLVGHVARVVVLLER